MKSYFVEGFATLVEKYVTKTENYRKALSIGSESVDVCNTCREIGNATAGQKWTIEA